MKNRTTFSDIEYQSRKVRCDTRIMKKVFPESVDKFAATFEFCRNGRIRTQLKGGMLFSAGEAFF